MAIEAETDDTATQDRLRSAAQDAAHELACVIRALIRLADTEPPETARATGELLHEFRIVARHAHDRAQLLARALDSVPGARERLALLDGEA